jgi:hypothetical protein
MILVGVSFVVLVAADAGELLVRRRICVALGTLRPASPMLA